MQDILKLSLMLWKFINSLSHLIELSSSSLENLIGYRAPECLLNILATEL